MSWRSDLGGPPTGGHFRRGNNRNENRNQGPFRQGREYQLNNDGNQRNDQRRGDRNQPSDNNHQRRGPRPPRKMGFKALEALTEIKDTEHLMLEIQNTHQGFPALLDEDVKGDFCVIIVGLLDRVFQDDNNNKAILKLVSKSKFLSTLNNYIKNIEDQDNQEKKFNRKFWENPDRFWELVISMCKNLFQQATNLTLDHVHKLLKTVKKSIPRIAEEHKIQASDLIIATALSLFDAVDRKKQEFEIKAIERTTENPTGTQKYIAPSDDYREVDIYPSCAEITTNDRFFFLNKNRIEGKYGSIHEYLDVQFRLLREDFVNPLREAVCKYLSESKERITAVRFCKGVKFLHVECVNTDHCYRIQFQSPNSKKRKINFEHSKRFMFGALLCFTKNNFRTMIFGKVAERKVKDLEAGEVVVGILNNAKIELNNDYLMLECNIYFEPYYQVLSVLQKMQTDNFPMQRYIIDVETDTQPPAYVLNPDPVFYEIEGKRFWPLNFPEDNFYGLNDSQQKAFKAALTQELAIIQGPPGTGKTYVGLKIAQTLLQNQAWYDRSPILLICYTNHALDQFLEGISEYTDKIVRVGGQSKNEKLNDFNIRKKKPVRGNRNVWEKREVLKNTMSKLEFINSQLQDIRYDRIVDFSYLTPFMEDHPAKEWFKESSNNLIIRWLLEGKTSHIQPFQRSRNVVKPPEEPQDTTEEMKEADIIEVDEHQLPDELITIDPSTIVLKKPLIMLKNVRNEIDRLERKLYEYNQIDPYNMTDENYKLILNLEAILMDTQNDLHYLTYILQRAATVTHTEKPIEGYVHLNPHAIPSSMRWDLYFYWLEKYKQSLLKEKVRLSEKFRDLYEDYEEIRNIQDVQIMKEELVVGLTTTGAARMNSALRALKCPIVIVEEAAEVLEAHIISALTTHCQHLILIGDHQQLQPSTADFKIQNYNLGVSLFERLILNKVQYHTLNVQHRMRPEISCLITPHIYPNLIDHDSVKNRNHIRGLEKSVYFLDHQSPEYEDQDSTSKKNVHEATFLIALAKHLILNGYEPKQITILAAYLGQMYEMMKLKKAESTFLAGVRIAVLDNYQGEECDIILLSLVRNNSDNQIGFLRRENRVCVALSRARDGFYMMGNINLLSANSELWTKIKTTLMSQDALGDALTLKCQIHPDKLTSVKTSEDFDQVAEGGCNLPCGFLLACGHKCKSLCHVLNPDHLQFKCVDNCNRLLCNDNPTHFCHKRCYEECGPCTYTVGRDLKCGHTANLQCHIDPEVYKCREPVSTQLPCGHEADKACSIDIDQFRCPHPCDIRIEPCGHACNRTCHLKSDPDHLEYQCHTVCNKRRIGCTLKADDAAHFCKKYCYEKCEECIIEVKKPRTICPHFYTVACNFDVDSFDCEKPCTKTLECGHKCKLKCKESCGPCKFKVEKQVPECNHNVKIDCDLEPTRWMCNAQCPRLLPCGHNCSLKCNQPCIEKCKFKVDCEILAECGHIITKLPCWVKTQALTNVVDLELYKYCNAPCQTVLKCGHPCPGTCGNCKQGRIHTKCKEKCSTILICNHECPIPCNKICKPCQKPCIYRCKHSKCPRKCGDVCTPCAEPCGRRCDHQQCAKKCGDICNVKPCTEPCPLKLQCGHDCVGFCSDTCPPLCRICDKDELTQIFLGNEDDDDARFVLLIDCGHVIEYEGLENWFATNNEKDNKNTQEIILKSCPRCKTNVVTTPRYSDYIKQTLIDIENIKQKSCGNPQENRKISMELTERLVNLGDIRGAMELNKFRNHLMDALKPVYKRRRQNQLAIELNSIEAKIDIYEFIRKCHRSFDNYLIKEYFMNQANMIIHILMENDDRISEQVREDINLELMRLNRIAEFEKLKRRSRLFLSIQENILDDVKKMILTITRYSDDADKEIAKKLKEINEKTRTGLNISETERIEIVRAMGMTSGHWFKCPNGHIYWITECGGAMQIGKCNECGATIGGQSHRLRSDNSLAREMDGARYAAWSEMNNLANFGNIQF